MLPARARESEEEHRGGGRPCLPARSRGPRWVRARRGRWSERIRGGRGWRLDLARGAGGRVDLLLLRERGLTGGVGRTRRRWEGQGGGGGAGVAGWRRTSVRQNRERRGAQRMGGGVEKEFGVAGWAVAFWFFVQVRGIADRWSDGRSRFSSDGVIHVEPDFQRHFWEKCPCK